MEKMMGQEIAILVSPMTKGGGKRYRQDQHYFVRKSSDSVRKNDMENVRHQMYGKNATCTVKIIILMLGAGARGVRSLAALAR